MKQITTTETFEIIREFGHTYAMAADTLHFAINNHKPTDCYTDGKTLLIVTAMRDEKFIYILPREKYVDAETLLAFFKDIPSPIRIIVDTQKLAADCAAALDDAMKKVYTYERTIEDFQHTADEPSDKSADNVKLLTTTDRDTFIVCTSEQFPNRPPLSLLFDLFVGKGQGHILAAYDREKIVGYLSFITVAENLYDTDFVYVDPAYQERGYGKLLADAYVNFARENGRDAYWSNAKTQASKTTAAAAGFTPIRTARKYVG